jgi:hypothetical protein
MLNDIFVEVESTFSFTCGVSFCYDLFETIERVINEVKSSKNSCVMFEVEKEFFDEKNMKIIAETDRGGLVVSILNEKAKL